MRFSLLALCCLPLACAESTGPIGSLPDGGRGRCSDNSECGPREKCNVAVGLCYPGDACSTEKPCLDPATHCEDGNGDGFNECVFSRCTSDTQCAQLTCDNGQVPSCASGGCICGLPCHGGCPPGRGCCIPEDACHDLPAECAGLKCPPGQFLSITSSGAWDNGSCRISGEACSCERMPPLPLGDTGLHSALAHTPEAPVLSAYNSEYGDLMFGIANPTSGQIAWSFIDGVPTTTTSITGDLAGPRGGNSDLGDDVGQYTDLAVDGRAQAHIAYHDRTHGALKYARGTPAAWAIHQVTTGGEAGLYASLALDAAGRPLIAYLSVREVDGNSRSSVLRLALATTSSPADAADWQLLELERTPLGPMGCKEMCRVQEVCQSSDKRCVTPDPPAACNPACPSEQRCVAGQCTAIDPLPPFRDLPMASGLWPSLQVQSDGAVLVAYYDRVGEALKIARIAGPDPRTGAVTKQVIDHVADQSTGLYPSLFVRPGANDPHVAYLNATTRALIYRHLDANLATVTQEVVDSGLGLGAEPDGNLIGADPALVVDAQNVPRIAYQDGSLQDLKYARRTGAGAWTVSTLRGAEVPYAGSFGFYIDQVLAPSGTGAVVSTYRYFLSAPTGNGNGVDVLTLP